MEPSDRIKELKDTIQESSKRLSEMWTPLAVHGQLLAATSEYSGILIEKLTISVDKLHKSSKRLEAFTAILIVFTLILGVVAIIELVKDFMPKYAVAILGIILLFALLYFATFLKKE